MFFLAFCKMSQFTLIIAPQLPKTEGEFGQWPYFDIFLNGRYYIHTIGNIKNSKKLHLEIILYNAFHTINLTFIFHSIHFTKCISVCFSCYAFQSIHITLCTLISSLHYMHFTLSILLHTDHSMNFALCHSLFAVHYMLFRL